MLHRGQREILENELLDEDLRIRARRLLSGDFRTGDLDRLFLGQRDRAWNRACFREIGDFVAHRDTREKGLVTQVGRDVFTSVDVWSLKLRGLPVSPSDIERAARANLRLASDEQLRAGCGCRRSAARKQMERAITKIHRNESLTNLEATILIYLGTTFIWRPAFTSNDLFQDFQEVLRRNGIIEKQDVPALNRAKTFLSIYALTIMHGSSIVLENGQKGQLFAGYGNPERYLEVKVEFVFPELGKPVITPICLFYTELPATEHCESDLIAAGPVLYNYWQAPIELGLNSPLIRFC